ncbi:MAG: universal stress protein [Microcoleus sp. SIO2G3]|nr:universal stress protein [Microcoleus sp. SIO2G3]
MSFQKILVAIDESSLCPSVFSAALELAHSNKAALKLLHCIAPEVVSEPMPPVAFDVSLNMGLVSNNYQTQQILVENQIEEAQAVLNRYSEEATRQGVPTTLAYEIGEAGYQLCDEAKDWGADLIVVGRRGRTGLTEALLGSVSNYVVHHAPCSVLVIQEVELEPPPPAVNDLSLGVPKPPSI